MDNKERFAEEIKKMEGGDSVLAAVMAISTAIIRWADSKKTGEIHFRGEMRDGKIVDDTLECNMRELLDLKRITREADERRKK